MPLFGELFVSEVLGHPVLNTIGEELGRLKDLIIVKAEHLPKVKAIIIERKKRPYIIEWSHLELFNKRIITARILSSELKSYDMTSPDLLAVRDILDKQIVDVNGIKVVRVNDIKLEGYESEALLIAVDVGIRGILRRLGIERWGEDILNIFKVRIPQNLISWNYIQPLQPKLTALTLTVPRQMLSELHPADIAELISQVPHQEGVAFLNNLDVDIAADTISELNHETQVEIIKDMDTEKASDIIEMMSPDVAADVLSELPAEKAWEILEHIEKEEAEDIQELLGHEKDTAGGLMTNEFIVYPPEITVQEVLNRFKEDASEIETVYYIYVTDPTEKLLGVLSLRELLLARADAKLSEIMVTKLKTVTPDVDEKVVAEIFTKYNLVALPVVDTEGALLGIVTVDDIMERIFPVATKRK